MWNRTRTWRFAQAVLTSTLLLICAPQAAAVSIAFDPWDWEITVQPAAGMPGAGDPPVVIPVWGNAIVNFDDSGIPGGLGDQLNPLALPTGGPFTIPIEIVALSLSSAGPVPLPGTSSLGMVNVELTPATTGIGEITVENVGGTLVGDSFFDVFVDITLEEISSSGPPIQLTTDPTTPWRLGMNFDLSDGIPAIDTFWLPSWVWLTNVPGSQLPPPILTAIGVSNPWDVVVDVHGHVTPEPATIALLGFAALGMVFTRRRLHM